MHVGIFPTGMCMHHMHANAHGSKKRSAGPLELKLQMAIRTIWMLWLEPWSLEEKSILLANEPSL